MRVVLKNPQPKAIDYEYWTCTTLAPGSDPNIPGPPAAPRSSRQSRPTARPTGWPICRSVTTAWVRAEPFRKAALLQELADDGHRLRGARYAGRKFLGRDQPRQRGRDHPHRRQSGHSGPENVDWGFPSFADETDPRKDPSEARPYVELWAGVSDQFFHSARFPARGEVAVTETFSPTVGMSNVTDANENILVNLSAEGASEIFSSSASNRRRRCASR